MRALTVVVCNLLPDSRHGLYPFAFPIYQMHKNASLDFLPVREMIAQGSDLPKDYLT